MWFKYGLKAQKLLAQGIALGMMAISKTPCKGESFMFCLEFLKLLPLQGALLIAIIPRAMPWARSFWAFSPFQPYSLNSFRTVSEKN